MTLFKGSRYRYVQQGRIVTADKTVETVFAVITTTRKPPTRSKKHVVQAGETFESIAAIEYGDGNKWYVLAEANPQIFFPFDLQSGEQLYIPPFAYAELI